MSTFGWVELHHLAQAIRTSAHASHLDAAGLITSIRNETLVKKIKQKKRVTIMVLMQTAPADSAGSGASSAWHPESDEISTSDVLLMSGSGRVATALVMKESYYARAAAYLKFPLTTC